MKVFLTGGTGFIGQRLVQTLIQRGWEVTALIRNPESVEAKVIQNMGAVLVRGDITDRESMRSGMKNADIVLHNAAWYELGISKAAHDGMQTINVQGTENTLGLAIELGIPKIVYVSTILAFGDTGGILADETFQRVAPFKSRYEQTKTEAHRYAVELQKNGAPIVIACPAGVIGVGDHSSIGYFARMYVRGWLPPMVFAINGFRAHVYVDDAAEGIVRCAERGKFGETYILCNGVMKHDDLFKLWKRTPGGMKQTFLTLPDSLMMFLNITMEPIERFLGLPMVFSREFALAALASWNFSGEKAKRELGLQFRSVEQAWLDTLAAEYAIAKNK